MNFAQEISALSPDQVQARIAGRLRDGSGPAWNESHGEPRWGLLLSAFHHWRRSESHLLAVDACLNKLLPELFDERAWPAAEAACSYVLALGNLDLPWRPSQIANWPFKDWLRQPLQAASDAQLQAMGSALRLMRHSKLVQEHWARENFRQVAAKVSGLEGSPWAIYLLDSWKAWAQATRPETGVVSLGMWFELLRQTNGLGASSLGAGILTLAMDWALGRCGVTERDGMVAALAAAIGHLPTDQRTTSANAASGVTAQAAALQAAEEVLGEFPRLAVTKQTSPLVGQGTNVLRNQSALQNRLSQPCQLPA